MIVLCDSLGFLTARVRLLISLLGSDDDSLIKCAVLIISIWILDCSGQLLSLKLLTYQILPSFLGDVPSSELIGTNPCDSFRIAGEVHLYNRKGYMMPRTYLIAIMTINNNPVPYDDRITTTVRQKVLLKLKVFLPLKRPDKILKFRFYL